MKRDWTLTHSLANGWEVEFFDVPRWRAYVARGGEWTLHACFDICCHWGWAYRILNWLVNLEYKAQVEVVRFKITDEVAKALTQNDWLWDLLVEAHEEDA